MSTFSVLDNFISLRRAVALLRAAESKNLEFGHNQISVLYKLSLGKATMSELVEHTLSDKASITRTIAALVEMDLVKRIPSEKDRRVTFIELTAKGKKQAEKAQFIRSSLGKKLESTLTAEERKQFTQLVEKIVSKLNQ
jgi:DNA-binding MarR family transcriptional regulator